MIYQFWIPFVFLTLLIIYCDLKYGMLRDVSQADPKPYSWSRVQLAWWTVIIISSFIAVLWMKHHAPSLHYSTIVLLGISALTTTTARVIDVNDQMAGRKMHQNDPPDGFLIDILSDKNGMSVHRLQAVAFNLVFGIWFIATVLQNLPALTAEICSLYTTQPQWLAQCTANPDNFIMPAISDNNLILLGVSSATYAAIKTTENKIQDPTPPPGNQPPNTVNTAGAGAPVNVTVTGAATGQPLV